MHKRLSALVLASIFLLGCPSGARGDDCQVRFDEKGLASVVHNGVTLVYPDDPRFRVQCVRLADGNQACLPEPIKSAFDAASKTLTLEYDWGKIESVFTVKKDRLDIVATLTNTGKQSIRDCVLMPMELDVPNIPANAGEWDHPRGVKPAALQEGTQDFLGHLYSHDKGVVGVVGDAFLYFKDTSPHGSRPLCAPGPDSTSPLAPGQTGTCRISLAFGPPKATLPDVATDAHADFVKANPMVLSWPDRRPMAVAFLCNSVCGVKSNPRGWFQGAKDVDVTTEDGVKAFGERLMKYADNSIQIMRTMDAQGIIIWDIEGQEMPHPTSYIGDPRALAKLAPEMERFADAFMKKFSDAGFKTGLTIRTSDWTAAGPYGGGGSDTATILSDKIDYAKKRWGTTIYYFDSDFGGRTPYPTDLRIPWVLPACPERIEPSIRKELGRGVVPASTMEKLAKLHPDCVIAPEFASRGLYRFCAPYSSPNLGDGGTDPVIRNTWPQAFRLVMTDQSQLLKNWQHFADSVEGGDVLLYRSWYDGMENVCIRLMYREAELHRKGALTALAKADLPTLLAKAKDPAEETRYAAASALGNTGKAEAVAPLATLLKDDSLLVRKQALVALARQPKIEDANCIGLLLDWVRDCKDPNQGALRMFAADALARAGDAVVPQLVAMLGDPKAAGAWPFAIRTLGRSGTADASAGAALIAILQDKTPGKAGLRNDVIEALGLLKVKDAVAVLVAILERRESSEPERGAAVIALGRIGDARAVEPLVKHFDVRYTSVVVYWLKGALDEALRSITGVQGVVGGYEWKAWWQKQQATAG